MTDTRDVAEQGIIFSQILQNRVLFSRRCCRTGYYFLADGKNKNYDSRYQIENKTKESKKSSS
jgi:hypothetical protein